MSNEAIKKRNEEGRRVAELFAESFDKWIDALERFSNTYPESTTKDGDENFLTVRIAFNPKNDHCLKMILHADNKFGECFYLPLSEEGSGSTALHRQIAFSFVQAMLNHFSELRDDIKGRLNGENDD